MAGFEVDEKAVAAFGRQVERQSKYATAVSTQVRLDVVAGDPADPGVLGQFLGFVREWQKRGQEDSELAAHILHQNASSLDFAAKWYGKTDRGNAANLDKTYQVPPAFVRPGNAPGGSVIIHRHDLKPNEVEAPDSAGDFKDVRPQELREPLQWPNKPTDAQLVGENHIESITGKVFEINNLLSVSWYVRQALQIITGRDVISEISRFVSGDWNALGQLAYAFKLSSDVFTDISKNTKRGMYAMQTRWTGRAADAMQNSMWALMTRGIDNHADFLGTAHRRILDFARAVYHTFVLIEDFLNVAIDTLTSGPIKLAQLTGQAIEKLLKGIGGAIFDKWQRLSAEMGNLTRMTHVWGVIKGYLNAFLHNVPSRLPWPGQYDHPEEH